MKPFPYQIEAVNEIDWFNGRAAVCLEPGLGKTLIALLWLRRHPEALPAVVVCPKSVKFVWEREARRTLGFHPAVLEGRRPSRRGVRPRLAVVNYDVLQQWLGWLEGAKPKTVILDESHYCANDRAKRTKAVKQLCKGVPNVLCLSGTPLVNRPIELWPVLSLLRPDVFSSRWSFAHEYCDALLTPFGWKYDGATKKGELHDLLGRTCLVRRLKSEVLRDLPEKVREVVPLPLSSVSEYRRADSDFLSWLQRLDPSAARRASRAEAMTRIGYLLRLSARLKLPFAADWVNDFLDGSDEKLVIFCVYRDTIECLRKEVHHEALVIDGSVTGQRRTAAVDRFQRDPSARLLIGNVQAAGVGITLTAARHVAVLELPWRPGDLTQAEDRCHRIGSKDTVFVHYLLARGTIEGKLCRVLRRKQEVLSAVLDGGATDELSVLDELMGTMIGT